LTDRGLTDARAIGLALARLEIRLNTCFSSPKRRALQTAQLACAPLGVDVTREPLLAGSRYDAEQLAVGRGETLLVGHNPTISGMVRELTGARVHLRPGGLAGIEHGELVVLMTPQQIGAIAQKTGADLD